MTRRRSVWDIPTDGPWPFERPDRLDRLKALNYRRHIRLERRRCDAVDPAEKARLAAMRDAAHARYRRLAALARDERRRLRRPPDGAGRGRPRTATGRQHGDAPCRDAARGHARCDRTS